MSFNLDIISQKYPVGTVEEVIALGIDPRRVATCSYPSATNMGCPYYRPEKGITCMFPEVRDANQGKGAGPENRGFYVRRGPAGTKWQGFVMPCHLVMKNESELMHQTGKTGHAYSRFYNPGEEVKQFVRVRRHPDDRPDKTCAQCKKGECKKMMDYVMTMEIKPYERPAEAYAIDAVSREVSEAVAQDRLDRIRGESAVDPIPTEQIEADIARQANAAAGRGPTLSDRITEAKRAG